MRDFPNETGTNPEQPNGSMSEAMVKSQIEVVIGMTLGTILAGLIGYFLWDMFEITTRRVELAERLGYAAKWSLLPGGCLLIGIMMIANFRFFTPAIDPLGGKLEAKGDRTLRIWQHFTQNTLEQAMLFALGAAAYATVTFQYWLKIIPIVAVLFVLGRALFVIGYLIRPTLRAAGFAMTFYPIIGLYAVTAYMLWF